MKNILKKLIDGSLGVSAASELIDIRQIYTLAVQHTASGTVAGTLTLQGSNDVIDPVNGYAPTNWATIGTPVTLSTPGSAMINLEAQGYAWFRVIFTANAGSGALLVTLSAKG